MTIIIGPGPGIKSCVAACFAHSMHIKLSLLQAAQLSLHF